MADDYVFERLLRKSRTKLTRPKTIAFLLEEALDTIRDTEDQETARRVLGTEEFLLRLFEWLRDIHDHEVRFFAACLLFVLAPKSPEFATHIAALEHIEAVRDDSDRAVLALLAGCLRYSDALVAVADSITRLGRYVARWEGEDHLTDYVRATLSFIFTDFPRMRPASIPGSLLEFTSADPEASIRGISEEAKAKFLRMYLENWRPSGRVN